MSDEASTELPTDVIETVTDLTRRARRADGDRADRYRQRRDDLLARYGYEARVREDDDGDVLVCYPAEWLEDGEVVFEAIDDRSRALEVPLDGETDDWEAVEDANRAIVRQVGEEHGPVHRANARAFADFMGNHRARRIADATAADVAEFRAEYYPRNAWPSDDERAVLEQSLGLAFAAAGVDDPPIE